MLLRFKTSTIWRRSGNSLICDKSFVELYIFFIVFAGLEIHRVPVSTDNTTEKIHFWLQHAAKDKTSRQVRNAIFYFGVKAMFERTLELCSKSLMLKTLKA